MERLKGKVALVTGGSSGIGRATCTLMAAEGATVLVADVNRPGALATVEMIGQSARFQPLDVTKETDWAAAIDQALKGPGRLDVVVNGAGIGVAGDFEDLSLSEWERLFAVNSTGVFLGCRYGIKGIRAGGRGGAIINIASMYGNIGSGDAVAYCASKGSVRLLTKAVALYCAGKNYGIRVNSVHPTYVDSEMLDPVAEMLGGREAMRAALSGLIPVGRLATPHDIAQGILFLASDEAAMMTGAELTIDGGQTAGIVGAFREPSAV